MADKAKVEVSFRAGNFYPRGMELDADDPIVKKYPSMFKAAVRTTAAVPGDVVDPGGVVVDRPAGNASKGHWQAYVKALGGSTDDLTKAELVELADELEG